jgi:predicted nuclease of predicted toxin-antitoxin system
MPLKIKLDEDISAAVGAPLERLGHTVRTVYAQDWVGKPDHELWQLVVSHNEFLVTADKGFGDLRTFPPGTHPGILLLRPDKEGIQEYADLVAMTLQQHALESLVGCITVATPRGIRIRRKAE